MQHASHKEHTCIQTNAPCDVSYACFIEAVPENTDLGLSGDTWDEPQARANKKLDATQRSEKSPSEIAHVLQGEADTAVKDEIDVKLEKPVKLEPGLEDDERLSGLKGGTARRYERNVSLILRRPKLWLLV